MESMGQSNGNHEHLGRGEGRGDPRRVAQVHAQTRRGLTQAAVFLAAAVAAVLAGSVRGAAPTSPSSSWERSKRPLLVH